MSRKSDDPVPYFQAHVFVCVNERPADHAFGSCAGRGAVELRDHLKAKAKALGGRAVCVTSTKCLSRCDKGPVLVIYPEGIWYQPQSVADVDEIFDAHLVKGGRVDRLIVR